MAQPNKTQMSITVKKESFYSQLKWKVFGHPFLWIFYIFKKSKGISAYVDKGSGNERYYEMEPNNEPYIFDLEPGYHEILFEDENADSKTNVGIFYRFITAIAIGSFVSGAGESGMGTVASIMASQNGKIRIDDGIVTFTI